MPQYNVTTDGAHLQNALVTPTGSSDPAQTLGNFMAKSIQTVDSLAALRTYNRYNVPVHVRYALNSGDGGGGEFYFDSSITQTRMVTAVTIAAGGSGYSANTLLSVVDGTSTRVARVLITAVTTGAVTSVILIDGGNYTADPPATGAATSCIAGTGCTLNITMGKFDNKGTLIAPTNVATGMWVRSAARNREFWVKWFGARGIYSGDDRQAIQNAINAAGPNSLILLGGGQFICANSIYLESDQTLKGETPSGFGTQLWASNTAVPLIKCNDSINGPVRRNIRISNIQFGGNGIPYNIQMLYAINTVIENCYFTSTCTQDNIHFNTSWGSRISNCNFGGSSYSLIHLTRSGSHGGNHAFTIENIYSSAASTYGILCDTAWGTCGINIRLNNCTIQGATTAQVALLSIQGGIINGLYTENGPLPLVLGDKASGQLAENLQINGCTFLTYTSGSPARLSKCRNITFSGCDLNVNGTRAEWLHYDEVQNTWFIGCYPSKFHGGVRRMVGANSSGGINIIKGTELTEGGDITMRTTGGTANQHYRMSINSSGQWVATEWIPTSL